METNSDDNKLNNQQDNNLYEEQDNQILQSNIERIENNNELNEQKPENNELNEDNKENLEKNELNEDNKENLENNELNEDNMEKLENNELKEDNKEKSENNELNEDNMEKLENNELNEDNMEKLENNELNEANKENLENNELNEDNMEKLENNELNEDNLEKLENNELNEDNKEKLENNLERKEESDINIDNINDPTQIAKLKKELNKNDEEIKQKNKYENYTLEELKKAKTLIDDKLIELYSEKNKSKEDLESIIKNISEKYTNYSDYLMDKKKDKYTIEKVKQDFEKIKKELQNSRKSNQTVKTQLIIYSNKINNVLTPEKISTFEEEIDKTKKENSEINEKINELTSKSQVNSIELRSYAENKKFPKKINNYTEDVKSFESIKHEYYTKLGMNKKSIENLIKEYNVLKKLYNIHIKEDSDKNLVNKLDFWVNLINQDLEGKIEDILERITKDESKTVKEIDKRQFMKKRNKNPLYLPIIEKSNREKTSINKNDKNLKTNKSVNLSSGKRQYQGIFSRFSFLKDNNSKSKLVNNISDLKNDINDNNLFNDYNNTSENDYRELLGKKEQLIEINSRLESKIKEISKNVMFKVKNVSRTVNDNSIRLDNLKQKNELINNEIINLEKVYELSIQQYEIKERIQNNESKFMTLQKQKINDFYDNIDNTNDNILKELKEEDEINRNKNIISSKISKFEKEKKNKKQKKIYLADSTFNSGKKIKFDIKNYDSDNNSNINRTELPTRKQKIESIKNKYFQIDNNQETEDVFNIDNYDFNNLELINKKITTVEQKE